MAINPDFKPGDVVRLKSDSPKMTVGAVMAGGQFQCVWFHEGEAFFDTFPAAVLEAFDDAAHGPRVMVF